MTDIDETAEAKAREASTPGTFSFIDRVVNRDYPTDTVEIYLNENAGLRILKLEQDRAVATDGEQANLIEKQIEAWREKAKDSRYIFHLEGISSEVYDSVVDAATENFPLEYNEFRNPLTQALVREVKDNPDREVYFRTHLWAKFIRKVEDSEGNVDDNITAEWIAVFANNAPLMAQVKIQASVDLLRMTTDWMDHIQDEDFLAKS